MIFKSIGGTVVVEVLAENYVSRANPNRELSTNKLTNLNIPPISARILALGETLNILVNSILLTN